MVRNKLLKTGDHLKTIDYFIKDEEGFLEQENVEELLTNL